MQNCRPVDSPMDPNLKLLANQSEMYPDPERYRRLVGNLIYLSITRPDISFVVGVVSQFMQNPRVDHWNAVMRILRYIKRAPGQGLLMKTKVIHKYLGIVMQIGLVVLWIGDPHPDIVSPLEGMLSLGKARSELLLPGPV